MATITGLSSDQAYYLAQTIVSLSGEGCSTTLTRRDGTRDVMIGEAGLDVLRDLPEHADGHFDGTHVWIGGSEYLVEGA